MQQGQDLSPGISEAPTYASENVPKLFCGLLSDDVMAISNDDAEISLQGWDGNPDGWLQGPRLQSLHWKSLLHPSLSKLVPQGAGSLHGTSLLPSTAGLLRSGGSSWDQLPPSLPLKIACFSYTSHLTFTSPNTDPNLPTHWSCLLYPLCFQSQRSIYPFIHHPANSP